MRRARHLALDQTCAGCDGQRQHAGPAKQAQRAQQTTWKNKASQLSTPGGTLLESIPGRKIDRRPGPPGAQPVSPKWIPIYCNRPVGRQRGPWLDGVSIAQCRTSRCPQSGTGRRGRPVHTFRTARTVRACLAEPLAQLGGQLTAASGFPVKYSGPSSPPLACFPGSMACKGFIASVSPAPAEGTPSK